MQDSDLDDLFARARAAGPVPSAGLIARIEADAAAQSGRRVVLRRPRRSRWAGLVAALGGGAVLAGLATATLAGVWIGVAQPASLRTLTDTVSGEAAIDTSYDRVELIPSFDPFVTEG